MENGRTVNTAAATPAFGDHSAYRSLSNLKFFVPLCLCGPSYREETQVVGRTLYYQTNPTSRKQLGRIVLVRQLPHLAYVCANRSLYADWGPPRRAALRDCGIRNEQSETRASASGQGTRWSVVRDVFSSDPQGSASGLWNADFGLGNGGARVRRARKGLRVGRRLLVSYAGSEASGFE